MGDLYFIVDMRVCEVKSFDDYFEDDEIEQTVEAVGEALTEKSVKDPCVMELREGSNVYFLFFDIGKKSDSSKLPSFSSQISFSSSMKDEESRIRLAANYLKAKVQGIELSFKAISTKLMEALATKSKSADEHFFNVREFQDKFVALKENSKQAKTMKDIGDWDRIFNEQILAIRKILDTIMENMKQGKVESKPKPAAAAAAAPAAAPSSDQSEEIRRLKKELQDAHEEIKRLRSQLQSYKPRPIFSDPGIKGKTLEFTPMKFSDDIIFRKKEGCFRYFFIRKDLVARLIAEKKLDPERPAKCLVEAFEHQCSTIDPEDTRIAQEYHMPKGEDYYLCTGQVTQDPK